MTIVDPLGVVPPRIGSVTNITPMTYRDGLTLLAKLENLQQYTNAIGGGVNKAIAELIAQVNEALANEQIWVEGEIAQLTAYVDEQVALIIGDSIQVQDPVIAGAVNDPDSDTTAALNAKYASLANLTAETNARVTGDTTLQTNITNEATARGNADTNLQNQINAIKNPDNYGFNLATSLNKWKAARLIAAGGGTQARIGVHGGSTPYGHFSGGPYLYSSWPGRLQRMLGEKYRGDVGTGQMAPWHAMGESGAGLYRPEWFFAGTIENRNIGVYNLGTKRATKTAGNGSYMQVGPVYGDTVRLIIANTSGTGTIEVDGATVGTFACGVTATGMTFPRLSGYGTNVIATDVPLGRLGWHTIKLYPNGTDGANQMSVLGVEARTSGLGGVVVSNFGLSGISTTQMILDNTTDGWGSMGLTLDIARNDLQIIQATTNDYQGHVPIATYKSRMQTFIDRAKATTSPVADSTVKKSSDVLLIAGQPVNEATIPPDGIKVPAFSEYQTALYELATANNCALLDLNLLFGSFAAGNAAGLYADDLHPSPKGHELIAQAVLNILTIP